MRKTIAANRVGMRVSPYGVLKEMGNYDATEETHVRLAEIVRDGQERKFI